MTGLSRLALAGLFTCPLLVAPAFAAIPFDNEKYMAVSEVHEGMTGYGLSVFSGDKIERFDVQVISILKNYNPGADVVLIRFSGQNLEKTGAIEGMSGSPIYLLDDQGRYRMIGAFAYGWRLAKDPIAGVQPIQYMLMINNPAATTQPANSASANAGVSPADSASLDTFRLDPSSIGQPATANPSPDQSAATGRNVTAHDSSSGQLTWSFDQLLAKAGTSRLSKDRTQRMKLDQPNRIRSIDPQATSGRPKLQPGSPMGDLLTDPYAQLHPLSMPLSISGSSGDAMPLAADGPAAATAGSASTTPAPASGPATQATTQSTTHAAFPFAPGSAIAVPLLTGDVDYSAVGTVTEVVGDQVLAFGHSFNSEGVVSLPMATARINGIVSNLSASFKLGETDRIVGSLRADEMVGVAGHVGPAPSMMPIDLTVEYADGQPTRKMHFNAVIHPAFTAEAAQVAAETALTSQYNLPEEASIEYDLRVSFANGRTVHVKNTSGSSMGYEPIDVLGSVVSAGMDNPFKRVIPTSIQGTIRVIPETRLAAILSVNSPRTQYQPGQTVKAYITYRPWRKPEAVMPVEFILPADLPEGEYSLSISDASHYLDDERSIAPYRFIAENPDDLFDMAQDLLSVPQGSLYIRLVQKSDGVSIGRTAMPKLPGTRRQIMLESGRSNVTPLASSIVQTLATPIELSGQESITIKIDRHARVQVGNKPHEVQPGNASPEHAAPAPQPQPNRAAENAPQNTGE